MPGSPFSSLFDGFAEMLDKRIGWDRLPLPVAMLTLIGLRDRLREENLYDTGRGAVDRPDISAHKNYRTARTLDGSFNDLNDPQPVPRDTDYASLIESDVPIVVQHTRLDSRNAEIALLSTMGFAEAIP